MAVVAVAEVVQLALLPLAHPVPEPRARPLVLEAVVVALPA